MVARYNSKTGREVSIGVCLGPRCGDYGGRLLLQELCDQGINAQAVDCQSLCNFSPVVRLPERCLLRATVAEVEQETG